MADGERDYLTVADILTIHELVVETSQETPPGVASRGDIEYTVEHIREGHFSQGPETVHAEAPELVRLLVANHPFVDGNKRTALASTVTFYALNGYELQYDSTLKQFLTELATDEHRVNAAELREHLDSNTRELPAEYRATYRLWREIATTSPSGESDRNEYSVADLRTCEMATDDETSSETPAPEEARRHLVRLITRHDIEKHQSLYDELEHE